MVRKYIHIQCEEYALLTDIEHVEQVVNEDAVMTDGKTFVWQKKKLPYLDLTAILMGTQGKNRHCIIMKDTAAGEQYLAVGVGQVSNIQTIKDEEFEDLPSLDFPFNDYFDKAYISKKDKRCIYRLKSLFAIEN